MRLLCAVNTESVTKHCGINSNEHGYYVLSLSAMVLESF